MSDVHEPKVLWLVDKTNAPESPDYVFLCRGCGYGHGVWVTQPNKLTGAQWTFNGNMEKPTFTPSVLVEAKSHLEKRCHLHVTDGMLHYCADCEHELAGKVVPMTAF